MKDEIKLNFSFLSFSSLAQDCFKIARKNKKNRPEFKRKDLDDHLVSIQTRIITFSKHVFPPHGFPLQNLFDAVEQKIHTRLIVIYEWFLLFYYVQIRASDG